MSTDTLITLGIAAVLIIVIAGPYFWRHRQNEREARERFERAQVSGLTAAVAMHPQIDLLACIGCGGCVDACPEGDVLGLIGGKAVLVHGAKCVGHALCAEACPVGGITMMMAAPGRSADLPVLSDQYETSVPGLFIVGELGGLGLIRNAINQGKAAVQGIAGRPRANGLPYDLVIVGAGPAGLSASLMAKKLGLRFATLEQGDIGGTILQYPRRKIVMTAPVEIPLWGNLKLTEVSKESLLEIWQKIITTTSLKVETEQKVVDLQGTGDGFLVATAGAEYRAQYVVLALGRRGTPRKLGVPGEGSSKVMYRLLDAEGYRDSDLLVVGGGDSAVEAAVGLALHGTNRVTLSYRQAEFTRLKERNRQRIEEYVKKKRLTVLFNSQVEEITAETVRLRTPTAPVQLRNDNVFIFAGGEMPFDLMRRAGIRFQNQVVN
jgi:thioredoxin reductase/ferredoxin